MKKLNIQSLGLSVNDLLTREQLKSIRGGSGSGGSSGDCNCYGMPGRLEHCFVNKIQCANPTVGPCPNGLGSGGSGYNCFEYCNTPNASCWL